MVLQAACATWYTGRGKKWEVHGAGWELDNAGKDLLDWTNHDAGTEWHFQYVFLLPPSSSPDSLNVMSSRLLLSMAGGSHCARYLTQEG